MIFDGGFWTYGPTGVVPQYVRASSDNGGPGFGTQTNIFDVNESGTLPRFDTNTGVFTFQPVFDGIYNISSFFVVSLSANGTTTLNIRAPRPTIFQTASLRTSNENLGNRDNHPVTFDFMINLVAGDEVDHEITAFNALLVGGRKSQQINITRLSD